MASQAQIEHAAGIDANVARYVNSRKTNAALRVIDLIRMQVSAYDPGGFGVLQSAVLEVRQEMEKDKDG